MAKSTRKSVGAPAARKPKERFASHDDLPGDDFLPDEGAHDLFEELPDDEIVEVAKLDEDVVATDDPVRMYLMQMGQIPLLDRAAEIAAAKKIERTRVGRGWDPQQGAANDPAHVGGADLVEVGETAAEDGALPA